MHAMTETKQQQHQRRQNRDAEHDREVEGKTIKPLLSFLVGVVPRLLSRPGGRCKSMQCIPVYASVERALFRIRRKLR
jgi:hypothetical protein